jgi:endonuclease/exonuclease/phosphatase family metal-dependent hydrolase
MEGKPPNQAEELADGLGYHVAYAPAWDVGGGLSIGNALLSRFPIVQHAAVELPVDERDERRCLLHTVVDAPCGQVPVFVTHLSWKLHQAHVRALQIREVNERVQALAPVAGFPPVLMGDMNAEPDSDEMRFLRGLTALGGKGTYFTDCFHVRGEGPGYTFSPDNPYTAVAREPPRRIDYVCVRGPDRTGRGQALTCRVVMDQPHDGVWASDHYGVLAEITA